MNLLHLEYFREVAINEHVQKTGEKLHVSPSAISAGIRSLEQELGVSLFNRSGRNMRLNEFGRQFLPYVEEAFSSLEKGVEEIRISKENREKQVSFSVKDGTLWEGFLLSFITAHPDIQIRQVNQDPDRRGKFLDQANLDFAITDLELENDALDHCVLFEDKFVLAVSQDHPLAHRQGESLSISEFQHDLFLLRPHSDVAQQYIDRMLKEIGFQPRKTMVMEYMLRYRVFNQGPGVIITTQQVMKYEKTLSEAVPLEIKEFDGFPFPKKLYWKKTRPLSSSALSFKEFLQEYLNHHQ